MGEDDQENGGADASSAEASVETAQANLKVHKSLLKRLAQLIMTQSLKRTNAR